jgi:hypothetical protein
MNRGAPDSDFYYPAGYRIYFILFYKFAIIKGIN